MFKMSILANAVLLAAVVACGAYAKNLSNKLALSSAQLGACGARVENILEDLESDNAIDLLDDSALTTVPAEWLLSTD